MSRLFAGTDVTCSSATIQLNKTMSHFHFDRIYSQMAIRTPLLSIGLSAVFLGSVLSTHAAPSTTTKSAKNPNAGLVVDRGQLILGRIEPGFRGVPLRQALNVLEKRKPAAKGEVETSAEFAARVERLGIQPLVGTITAKDILAFVATPKSGQLESGPIYVYDADNAAGYVRLQMGKRQPFFSYPDGDSASYTRVTFEETKVATDTYVGSNAYGASTNVRRSIYEGYGLAFTNVPGGEVRFDMPPARAAKELASLRMVLFVDPTESPFVSEEVRVSPTRDLPYDTITRTKYLKGLLRGYVVYSAVTGEVFGQQTYGAVRNPAGDDPPTPEKTVVDQVPNSSGQ